MSGFCNVKFTTLENAQLAVSSGVGVGVVRKVVRCREGRAGRCPQVGHRTERC